MSTLSDSVIVRTLMPLLVSSLQLFSVYVVMHGHYSPGGGFQAGVLLAASFILPMLMDKPPRRYLMPRQRSAVILAAVGVFVFALFALVPLPAGRPMLDYASLPMGESFLPADRRSLGILGIEIGVMLAVAGAVVSIFHTLRREIDQ
jgi:multicomponent Na+:H+ antiporter subunit B